MTETVCHCGLPLHYSSPQIKAVVDKIIAEHGEYVLVTTPWGSYLVPRHYIALHGLKAQEVPNLGFEKVSAS